VRSSATLPSPSARRTATLGRDEPQPEPASSTALALGDAPTRGGRGVARSATGSRRTCATADRPPLLLLAASSRFIWHLPQRSLIFDEAYYVNAARVLLGWTDVRMTHYGDSPVGLDPNTEHPPLGKLVIAGSMLLFGDNGYGWRIPSIVAGLVALAAVYGIARASGATAAACRSSWLASSRSTTSPSSTAGSARWT
jgi:hypothetical protein